MPSVNQRRHYSVSVTTAFPRSRIKSPEHPTIAHYQIWSKTSSSFRYERADKHNLHTICQRVNGTESFLTVVRTCCGNKEISRIIRKFKVLNVLTRGRVGSYSETY
jgi:hypothetical protein